MALQIDPGIYTNFFQANISGIQTAGIVWANVTDVGSAKELRDKVRAHIYQIGPTIYGYGPQSHELLELGFYPLETETVETPELVARMLADGFLDRLEELGYETERTLIRHRAYHPDRAMTVSLKQARIFPGYQIRSSFFRDPLSDGLIYGLVIDPWYRLELNGKPTNFGELRQFASSQGARELASAIVPEVMMKIGMLTPYRKRNRESFKSKVERTVALLLEAGTFSIGGESSFLMDSQPTRVVMQE